MNGITTTFQLMNVAVYVATLAAVAYGWRQRPAYRAALVPPGLAAGLGVVFYALLLGGRLSAAEMLMWGSVHRLFAGLVIFGATVTAVWILGDER